MNGWANWETWNASAGSTTMSRTIAPLASMVTVDTTAWCPIIRTRLDGLDWDDNPSTERLDEMLDNSATNQAASTSSPPNAHTSRQQQA